MFSEYLEDLDALVLACRNLQSKIYLQEAVRAYRASAYRASIVACWIAVVCDYLHKLEELSLGGDAQAQNQLETLSKARENQNVQGLLEFERRVLEHARDTFAFISASEYRDLERLQHDRNRCAHPAFDSNGELFNPPAELARLHIRNSVHVLLMHPPTQGKSSIQHLAADVESLHFPKDAADAIKHFKHGPLARPRDVLVRNFVRALLKYVLDAEKNLSWDAALRGAAALSAVREMHRSVAEAALQQSLNHAVHSALISDRGTAAIRLAVLAEDVWPLMNEANQESLKRLLGESSFPDAPELVPTALHHPHLRDVALRSARNATRQQLEAMAAWAILSGRSQIPSETKEEMIRMVIVEYERSSLYRDAHRWGKSMIIPLIPHMDASLIRTLVIAMGTATQIKPSWSAKHVLEACSQTKLIPAEEFSALIQEHGLQSVLHPVEKITLNYAAVTQYGVLVSEEDLDVQEEK